MLICICSQPWETPMTHTITPLYLYLTNSFCCSNSCSECQTFNSEIVGWPQISRYLLIFSLWPQYNVDRRNLRHRHSLTFYWGWHKYLSAKRFHPVTQCFCDVVWGIIVSWFKNDKIIEVKCKDCVLLHWPESNGVHCSCSKTRFCSACGHMSQLLESNMERTCCPSWNKQIRNC